MTEVTPGQLLVASREQRGLSQADVAKELRLSLQTIKDVESDNYEHIGVRTFVRGYLCSYARLTHLPESRVLKAFDALSIPEFEDQIVSVNTIAKNLSTVADAPSKKFNLNTLHTHMLVIFGMTALVVVGWGFSMMGSRTASSSKAQTAKPLVQANQPVKPMLLSKKLAESFQLVDDSTKTS